MSTVTAPSLNTTILQRNESRTTSYRGTAVLVGLLFLIATAAFIAANALTSGVLGQPDYLTVASAENTALAAGALLLLGQFGVVGIAVLLYPVLKRDWCRVSPNSMSARVVPPTSILTSPLSRALRRIRATL
jgi:hypothetical protein